jgi:hypothetical protein
MPWTKESLRARPLLHPHVKSQHRSLPVPARRTAHSEHGIGGSSEQNANIHTTVQNQLNQSTLTKFQTLMTFLTVRVSASYKNFYPATHALLTTY